MSLLFLITMFPMQWGYDEFSEIWRDERQVEMKCISEGTCISVQKRYKSKKSVMI